MCNHIPKPALSQVSGGNSDGKISHPELSDPLVSGWSLWIRDWLLTKRSAGAWENDEY